MRIEGYIDHPSLKITVFKMNNRLSVKVESGLYELTYKFREGMGIENLADVEKLLDASFLEQSQRQIQQMHLQKMTALRKLNPEEQPFDDII